MRLSDQQIERYSRQILVPEIGGSGQEKLLSSALTWRGESAAVETTVRYLQGSGIDAASSSGEADVVIVDRDALPLTETFPADAPLLLLHCAATTAWYSEGCTASDCPTCIGEAIDARASSADGAEPAALALVLGCAAALELTRRVLGLGTSRRALIEIADGGLTRRRFDIEPGGGCRHRSA